MFISSSVKTKPKYRLLLIDDGMLSKYSHLKNEEIITGNNGNKPNAFITNHGAASKFAP